MKFLQDAVFTAMKQASDSWNNLVRGITQANPEMKPEEVTPEVVIEAMNREEDPDSSDLAGQLSAAQADLSKKTSEVQELTTQLAAANAQIKELKGTSTEEEPEVKADGEPTGGESDIKEFASKNAGNTAAIMAEAKRTNFI